MLVVLPATIYTCNGVWYNQPSSTERFRYVLLPARIMRRRRPLRLFSVASLHIATFANTNFQHPPSLRTYSHSLIHAEPNETGRQTSTAAQSLQTDKAVCFYFVRIKR
jgi:hypothetical protein